MPGMSPNNNTPWWAPGRPLIVSDPEKLTYFARANAVRAGVQSMPGALTGVAVGDSEWANPFAAEDAAPGDMRANMSQQMFDATVSAGPRQLPMSVAGGSMEVTGSNIETPSGGGTLDSFFNSFNKFMSAPAPQNWGAQPVRTPSPWPWVVGVGAVGLGLLWLSKRRRA